MINDLSQKSYFQGVCLPAGYTSDIRPPKKWSRIIDGHRVTPRIIHNTLLKCREAGCDMEFIAQKLNVGSGAIREFIANEKSIPIEIAEKFYQLFTSGNALPKAAPEPPHSVPIWEAAAQIEEELKGGRPKKFDSPDVESERLGKVFIAERLKREWSLHDVAKKVKASEGNIRRAEDGKIFWITVKTSLLCRLCKLYGLDIRDYETKKRINFRLFQKKLRDAKNKLGVPWEIIARNSGVSRYMLASYYNTGKKRQLAVYLTPEIIQLMEYMRIDPESVILKEEE